MDRFGMTPLQSQALDFIRSFIEEKGYSPSYYDICEGVGIASRSGAHRVVHGLIERGHIRMIPRRHRAIEIT